MRWIPDGVRSSVHPLDLAAAARDLWPRGTLDFVRGRSAPRPAVVTWPETEGELASVLDQADRNGVAVVCYGAGSGICGGARGREGSIVVDTKRFDAIGPIDPVRRTVEAGAGVIGQHLEDWLNARGFTLGHSPSSIWCSTVGGWAAARSAGQFSSRYGVFEDMVLSMRAVAPRRGAFTVGEGGDAPPDWMELLLGSEGTLAVVTQVRMRIWPLPDKRWMRGYRMPDVESAVRAMRRLMQGELWPAVVRLYDPVDTRIGGRTKPKSGHTSVKQHEQRAFYKEWLRLVDDIPPVRRRLLSLPLALPGVINQVFDRLASGCLLVIGFEGNASVVDAAAEAGHRILCEEGEDLGAEPGERWLHSRHAVSYKLMPIFERGGFADTMEVACRWADLVPLYHAVREALAEHAVVMAHMSHVYPEGASIYFSFAGRGDTAVYDLAWRAALDAVLAIGGTVTHHHGVGELKAAAASAEIGPAIRGWRAAKSELDPGWIMNPGRLYVDGPLREGPLHSLRPEDGLVRVPVDAEASARAAAAAEIGCEPMWPWERLPGPPPWQRLPWQTGWIEVSGMLDGVRCTLGRAPRSAAGTDLRPWLARRATEATVTFAVASVAGGWMGEGRPERPWAVAQQLLKCDLRPAHLTVADGVLRVGFRGPAAAQYGEIAASLVPGGLTPVGWRACVLPAGPLEPCDVDDTDVVWVTIADAFRRPGGQR